MMMMMMTANEGVAGNRTFLLLNFSPTSIAVSPLTGHLSTGRHSRTEKR